MALIESKEEFVEFVDGHFVVSIGKTDDASLSDSDRIAYTATFSSSFI